jgi:hypothetical protein
MGCIVGIFGQSLISMFGCVLLLQRLAEDNDDEQDADEKEEEQAAICSDTILNVRIVTDELPLIAPGWHDVIQWVYNWGQPS